MKTQILQQQRGKNFIQFYKSNTYIEMPFLKKWNLKKIYFVINIINVIEHQKLTAM